MNKNIIILFTAVIFLLCACRKPFEPAVIKRDYNYLVIDGVINAGANGITTINLSRTRNLTDTVTSKPELNAQVTIEVESGTAFPLASQGNGAYTSAPLTLTATTKYRLRINAGGKTYLSDLVPVKQTPPIDSLSWAQDSVYNDVTIYAHTHDPSNNTRYYRWDYVETWQYHAAINAAWGVTNGLAYFIDIFNTAQQQYNCWGTINSTTIATGNSDALSQDVISYAPVNKIIHNAEKLMLRYSINVRQYALTKEAYQYWQIIEKSTQQTGTIFDPQPSQVLGNIHCITDPNEPVIGFVSISGISEKRIFIDHSSLRDWLYTAPGVICVQIFTFQNPTDYRIIDYPDTTFSVNYFQTGGGLVLSKKDCLDCRRRGGTNIKPSFWQ